MAEIATIARPYAEALFKASAAESGGAEIVGQIAALGAVARDPQLRRFADNPNVDAELVFNVMADVVGRKGVALRGQTQNFLRTLIANGRIDALPEIASQFQTLVNSARGISDATIVSAFPLDQAQVDSLLAALQPRFGGRRLNATVQVDPELIGGVRVIVGDEVLDTSVRARLESMKAALTA
jgi:F-type H+-transporting ATPase subunit delta